MNRGGRASAKTAVCPKTRSIPPSNKFPRRGQYFSRGNARRSWRARRDGRRSVIGVYDSSDRNARHSTRRAVEVRWTEVLHHRPLRLDRDPNNSLLPYTLALIRLGWASVNRDNCGPMGHIVCGQNNRTFSFFLSRVPLPWAYGWRKAAFKSRRSSGCFYAECGRVVTEENTSDATKSQH